MATAERINASYICRVLRLTLLVPDIVEAILNGRQPAEVTLAALMRPFEVEWGEQNRTPVPARHSFPLGSGGPTPVRAIGYCAFGRTRQK